MNKKNILLVYPKTGFEIEHVNLFMPMGLMCIATPLIKEGFNVRILDQRINPDFYQQLEVYLKEDHICVGITTMTGIQILYALEIASFVRKHSNAPIVWGGVHPTLTAEQTIENINVDIVVRGEGEVTFKHLVEALHTGGSLKNIEGISWKKGSEIFHNSDRPYCDYSKLSRVDYSLIDVERYLVAQVPGGKRCLNVYSSRGCPRRCSFCYNTRFNKSAYRIRNIDDVIEEISWLVKTYNLDSVCLNDDNFAVDIDRAHYFCEKLIEKNMGIVWDSKGIEPWQAEKMDLELMAKSGCRRILMGIESGSERILKFIRRADTIAGIKRVVEKFAASKIIAHYDFIIGFPSEKPEDLAKTLDMIDYIRKVDNTAYFSSLHIFTPFPGTELARISEEKFGFVPPKKLEDWHDFRLEAINVPWIPEKKWKMYKNLCLIAFFLSDRLSNRTDDKFLLRMFKNFLMNYAGYRWKNRQFDFCPEFQFLNWLMNFKIKRKINAVSKKGILS